MTPEQIDFFEGWWEEAMQRMHAKHPGLSWDRLACLLLWMFINEEEPP